MALAHAPTRYSFFLLSILPVNSGGSHATLQLRSNKLLKHIDLVQSRRIFGHTLAVSRRCNPALSRERANALAEYFSHVQIESDRTPNELPLIELDLKAGVLWRWLNATLKVREFEGKFLQPIVFEDMDQLWGAYFEKRVKNWKIFLKLITSHCWWLKSMSKVCCVPQPVEAVTVPRRAYWGVAREPLGDIVYQDKFLAACRSSGFLIPNLAKLLRSYQKFPGNFGLVIPARLGGRWGARGRLCRCGELCRSHVPGKEVTLVRNKGELDSNSR